MSALFELNPVRKIQPAMEKVNFGYSLKNIPVPPSKSYMKILISKVESLLRRMRWKAHFYDKEPQTETTDNFNYGFKTEKAPSAQPLLIPFENDIYAWISNIQYRKHRSEFQNRLTRDRKDIQESSKIFVPADKSTNMYKMSAENYKNLLRSNVTANYKKADADTKRKIDLDAKEIATDLKLDDRVEQPAEREAFVTLKDHKENFENNPKCRLINPAKSEIGIISKHHLQEINTMLRNKTKYLQWTNTQAVLRWFECLPHHENQKFVQFDIEEFYPNIGQELLTKAFAYAQSKIHIDPKIMEIVMHCRQSLLFTKEGTWVKKSGGMFDVTMGSYDGAEVCELVGIYLLNQVNTAFPNISFGLYRDDGLGTYQKMSGPKTEQTRKSIIKLFKENGLSVIINMDMTQANFLDVSMNIETGKYKPYRKPNSQPMYVNKQSNHPPTIVKQIPLMIQNRLSSLSCNEEEFNNAKRDYSNALTLSGYETDLKFQNATQQSQAKRKRKRNVIWFNPPYNEAVKTRIEKDFYQLIDKHFPKHHRYHKIFNRHNVRLSYSCTPNMKTIISSHNKKLLNEQRGTDAETLCNCRRGTVCPLDGQCQTPAIVYQAQLRTEDRIEYYTGSTEPPWKLRYTNHKASLTHVGKRNETGLSKRVWELRGTPGAPEPTITWSIHSKSHPYRCGSRLCDLCLSEKLAILKAGNSEGSVSLNVKSELMSKCRHNAKFKLKKV